MLKKVLSCKKSSKNSLEASLNDSFKHRTHLLIPFGVLEESKIETMDVGTYSTVMFGLRLNRLIVREN